MKILHVAAGLQETCGVSNFVVETARAQQALGHEVAIVTTMTCGYPVADLDVRLMPDPTSVDFTPDVVHLHSTWNRYVHAMARWSRARGIPYVISPHGALTPWALRYKWWKKWPALLLYQYSDFRHAAAFHVTVAEEEADVRRLRLRQPICTAPLGVTLPSILPQDNPFHDILSLGRIHPKKNLESLLDAWHLLSPEMRRGWRIILAGPDDVGHQAVLAKHAASLGFTTRDLTTEVAFGKKQIEGGAEVPAEVFQTKLADCAADVVFTGSVYSEAKEYLYQSAQLFALPSHSENFGYVVLEALAAGTPVIASTGTPWQTLPQNHCGWWVDCSPKNLADTLAQAMTLPQETYSQMQDTARQFVRQNYSWQTTAQKLLDLYQNT